MNIPGIRDRKILGLRFLVAAVLWGLALPIGGETAASRAIEEQEGALEAPQFQNAQLTKRAVQGTLGDEVAHWTNTTREARWLGYAVEEVAGNHSICCSNGDPAGRVCGSCKLEQGNRGLPVKLPGQEPRTVRLEGARQLAILFRAEDGKIGKIRALSTNCIADAGGLEVLWLEGVRDSEAVALLAGYVNARKRDLGSEESLGKSALAAMAFAASAERRLESFVQPGEPDWLRRGTAFWLGAARGAEGLRALEKMARNDPSAGVREQVTLALSVSPEPGAVNEMIRMAHDDQSSKVRGQALFWLAEKAGQKALQAIAGAIEDDPDSEVKKKAVFALSQLPRDEGVPKLIQVAQFNKNPEVRKQAMFWLGQSDDPRALKFFEQVLSQ
jgi:HEAT repeat protein